MKIALRAFGALLLVAGAVLTFAPELVHGPTPADLSLFETIELRVSPGGALLGVGGFFLARVRLRPLLGTFFCFAWVLVLGFLVARLAGLALDGIDDGTQWMWVVVEVVILGIVAPLYLWAERRAKPAEEPAPEAT